VIDDLENQQKKLKPPFLTSIGNTPVNEQRKSEDIRTKSIQKQSYVFSEIVQHLSHIDKTRLDYLSDHVMIQNDSSYKIQ
jgi:hypothetical protein